MELVLSNGSFDDFDHDAPNILMLRAETDEDIARLEEFLRGRYADRICETRRRAGRITALVFRIQSPNDLPWPPQTD